MGFAEHVESQRMKQRLDAIKDLSPNKLLASSDISTTYKLVMARQIRFINN